ncbi:hypothetical protein D9615_008416 [Tricholomella constricta]|uniref:Uncharacterized protein n=1 Tax=Tricholomella constricta TaxID=117010 RepID=A0A8H5HDQ8_9AGAR|nr:hypothetical protein D9615_008416 [Tricholomella constricta]
MSKLRKAPPSSLEQLMVSISPNIPISRTLKFAQDVSVSLWPMPQAKPHPTTTTTAIKRQPSSRGQTTRFDAPAPSTSSPAEQYWAARAFTAETLLSAREVHQRELQDLVRAEEVKRAYEISILGEQHKERHASLEKLVVLLISLVAVLVALVIYLATHYARHSTTRATPSHFTIPILSPFTSVVEHETSVIGSKTIAMVLLVLSVLAYLFIRIRFAR